MLPVEVTPFDVQRYRDALENAGRQPAGVNRHLTALRSFFAWAIEAGHASTNPVQSVKGVRQGARTPKALTAQEVYRLQREGQRSGNWRRRVPATRSRPPWGTRSATKPC